MFKLQFVNVDRDICSPEIGESACMVEMKVAHDHCLDILDVVTGLFDRLVEFLVWRIVDSCEEIIERGSPDIRIIRTSSGFEEDQSFRWMLDQCRNDDSSTTLARRVRVGACRRAGLCTSVSIAIKA